MNQKYGVQLDDEERRMIAKMLRSLVKSPPGTRDGSQAVLYLAWRVVGVSVETAKLNARAEWRKLNND